MNELPSTSSGSNNEGHLDAATHKTILKLAENAERQRIQELVEKRAELERYLQKQTRQRERDMRLLNVKHNRDGPRLPARDVPLEDPYDSSESGYCSIREKMHSRERHIQRQKERKQKKEEKEELDAIFHVMLHGSDDFSVADSSEYVFKFPEFMKYDEIKRGFDEQMKVENANRRAREAAERRAAGIEEPEQEEIKAPERKNIFAHLLSGYKFPPPDSYWDIESTTIKKEEKPNDNEVIEVYASSDEEDNNSTAITKRAMKWTNCSTSTSAGPSSNCTATSSAIINVHDSDSE